MLTALDYVLHLLTRTRATHADFILALSCCCWLPRCCHCCRSFGCSADSAFTALFLLLGYYFAAVTTAFMLCRSNLLLRLCFPVVSATLLPVGCAGQTSAYCPRRHLCDTAMTTPHRRFSGRLDIYPRTSGCAVIAAIRLHRHHHLSCHVGVAS